MFSISLTHRSLASLSIALLSLTAFTQANAAKTVPLTEPAAAYSVPTKMWPLDLGGHRAKVRVAKPSPAVHAHLPWRLQMKRMETHQIVVIHADTGKSIKNVVRVTATRMAGDIVFEAKSKGDYFIYYLPVRPFRNMNDRSGYVKYHCEADTTWRTANHLTDSQLEKLKEPGSPSWKKFPEAKLIEFQARTTSDRFDPMELIASKPETQSLLKQHPENLLIFPENRKHPIRMQHDLPLRWILRGPTDSFHGKAFRHEYYAFQLGVFASRKEIKNLTVKFSDLTSSDGAVIPASAMTCFNLGGIDSAGHPFQKVVNVPIGRIQPLWMGVDVAKDQRAGIYSGTVKVAGNGTSPQTINVKIKVLSKLIAERGDNEAWRHSRLRWLNSKAGTGITIPEPYEALKVEKGTISCLGRQMKVGASGLPSSIVSGNSPVLKKPIQFIINSSSGPLTFTHGKAKWLSQASNRVSWETDSKGRAGTLSCRGEMEYDGHLQYRLSFTPTRDINLTDIRLEIPYRSEAAQYILGAGHSGGVRPKKFSWNWTGPYNSFWLGSTDAGLHCKLLGGSYTGPMLNLYHPKPPTSWGNHGKGGVRVVEQGGAVTATAFSGARQLKAGVPIQFEFSLMITPLKPLDPKTHFKTRYFHTGDNWRKDGQGNDPEPSAANLALGVNVINVHHAAIYNPYINYPFIRNQKLKDFTARMHAKGAKVKVYNTVRELTSMVTELWALRSLGDEVIASGGGGGYSWCQEHMITGYRPAWFQRFGDSPPDAAFVTSGDSRWQNYYVEGIGWLVRNIDIDGIYLDDVSFDRKILQRVRTIMAKAKSGCLIDLHSNNAFSKGCSNHYMEFLPYIDRPWFGESFNYDTMTPEEYLVQVSGIPFGLMGEMLHAGGNQWRGPLYGMTNRLGWTTNGVKCDPRPVWKIWDRFGISDAEMVGYWQSDCPVKTDNPQVYATVYKKQGSIMIALASWAPTPVKVHLKFDWKALGLNPSKTKLFAPYSRGFQKAQQWKPGAAITVEPRKGWLIIADEKGPNKEDMSAPEASRLSRKVIKTETFHKKLGKNWSVITSKLPGTSIKPSKNGLVIKANANISACIKSKLPRGVTAVECQIENKGDQGETWGTGLTLEWSSGEVIRINLRAPEHAFGLESTGGVQRLHLGHLLPGSSGLRLRLEKDEIIAETSSGDGDWEQIGTYPRADFPGDPQTVILGKTRGVVDTADHTTPGAPGASIIHKLIIYGK